MKTLKYAFKNEWYNIILLLLPFIAIPFLWDILPDQIPTHWNFQGEVDGYSSKKFGLLFTPVIAVSIYLVLLYLPKIDPKKRIKTDRKPIPALRTLINVFLLFTHGWMISNGMNIETHSPNWFYLGIAAFFLMIGNYLRTIKPNYFIGIRIPWALEDSENWKKTHRLGSYVWVTGGLLLIILFPFFTEQSYVYIFSGITLLLALIPTIYSFYLYKKKQPESNS